MKNNIEQACPDCYQIICKECGWEANEQDTTKIQKGTLTACPLCGWQPGR